MSKLFIPENYSSPLDVYKTQKAISFIKQTFQSRLSAALNLKRVSAPLFVTEGSGLNDNLNGFERPVSFDIPAVGECGQVVHSLAKWKRVVLGSYGFSAGEGLYTDMNAIRRDEEMDNIHSIYTDQWDWEKIITRKTRTISYLKTVVRCIVSAICETLDVLKCRYPQLTPKLKREVTFVTSQELEDLYPGKTGKEREYLFVKEHKTVFIIGVGDKLKSGLPHDNRAPDYDDWSLNGDIMFYNELLDCAFEISSMGIRVDERSLAEQLEKSGCQNRSKFPYHKALLEGKLPLTMGGGIGQSRLSMLLLNKAHIGEVQVSLWDEETKRVCAENNIVLL